MRAMSVRPGTVLLACAVLLSTAAPAQAQSQPIGNKKKALELYDKAKIQYDLGHWKQAIELWVQAYETYNAPEFLFNIAQAYRQDGNCERALFFYRRYLATRPNAPNRAEVEGFMKELEAKCKPTAATPGGPKPGGPRPGGEGTGPSAGTEPSGKPAIGTTKPTTGPSAGNPGRGPDVADTTEVDGGEEDGEEIEDSDDYEQSVSVVADRPHIFAARVAAGPSFPSLGPLDVSTVASFSVSVGHPFYVGKFVIEPGVLVTYTPLPWEVTASMTSGTAGLTGLLADLGASYEFIPSLSGRIDLGAGALLFSGLDEPGNPFLEPPDFVEEGAIPLFNARVALGAEYAVTTNFTILAQPVVFSYSPSSPLRDSIDKITRFEMLVGAGYRM
jgi:hypothetical protein